MRISLTSLGWTGHPTVPAGLEPGRVARADRGICTVLTATGPVRASLGGPVMTAAAADPVALACTGDWVALRRWPDDRITIEMVLPRRTAIIRRTAGKDSSGQVLAANVDTAAVVASLDPTPEVATIERLLALAWDSGAEPCLVLTKADLVAYPEGLVAQLEEVAPGVPVVAASVVRGDGMETLRSLAGFGRTLGLIGASGAGKSSLVNALAGEDAMPTQAIRRADGKGRHTTTYRALVPVPGGGAVLDTPGLRAVGLLDGVTGLDRTFSDVLDIATGCQFPDCRHDGEPGCAIAVALASGELPHRRWASWLKLLREIEFEQRRNTARVISRSSMRRK